MKTLSELKRDLASGEIALELVERYGKTWEQIPERFRGIRRVKSVNTVGAILVTDNGMESEMCYGYASLCEYDGKTLTFYDAGKRETNSEERKLLEEWRRIEREYDARNPYGSSYWLKKDFFERKHKKYSYLSGFGTINGMRYWLHDNTVSDKGIKGEPILKYIIKKIGE